MKGMKKSKGEKLDGFVTSNNRKFLESIGIRNERMRKEGVSLGQELEVNHLFVYGL